MGQISDLLHDVTVSQTPLQKRLAGLGKVVALLCIVVCILVFFAGVFRGEPIFDMLMTGITIAIAAIPEGLPATVTIALALAVSRMMKHQALVNRLHSVETLGCAGILCADKTGTITENDMTVTDLVISTAHFSVDQCIRQQGAAVSPEQHPALQTLLECCMLCTTAEHTPGQNPIGDPTETALLIAAEKAGFSRERCKQRYPLHHMEPFDSETKKMEVTVSYNGTERQYLKGAADRVLPLCTQLLHGTTVTTLTESFREEVRSAVQTLSERALRVLAFAYRESDGDWIFLGLSGIVISLLLLATSFIFAAQLGDSGKWLSIVLIFLYVGFFAISIGPLGWLIVSEVFPQKLRGLGTSLGSLSVWFFNAIVSFTFFKILKVFSISGTELTINGESQGNPAGAFLFYAFIGIVAIIWGYFYVPETKGVSLEKIEAFWRKGGHPKDKII